MKKPILILIGLLVVLFGVKAVLTYRGADDKALVKEALQESLAASKEGRPGGVMDKISEKIQVNGEQVASTNQIANWIKASKPDVIVEQQDPVISGNQAQITSPVRVQATFPGGASLNQKIDGVTLIFEKEDAMEWLIIPTKKWRLKEVKLPPDVMGQFSPM